ncbi:MAG TPA: hypothetical protein VJA21_14710 [Verrucomicrobiae bacterium]
MKSIWQQYRMSAALDNDKTQPDPRTISGGEEGRAFARSLATLDQQLKNARSDAPAPPFLHESIMAKVRRQAEAPATRPGVLLGWWAAPACAAALVVCFFLAMHFARRPALRAPVSRPQEELAALPDTVLSPLSDELEHLQRDLRTTTDFLLASLP